MQSKSNLSLLLLLAAFSSFVIFANGTVWLQNSRNYFVHSCSNPSYDSGWNYPAWRVASGCAGNNYIPMAGTGETLSTTLLTLPSHSTVQISFNLALLDSWDTETFYVNVDGSYRYSTVTAWEWHNDLSSRICATACWPEIFLDVSFSFAHSADSMTITFSSNLDQVWWDEAWGICNLNIQFVGCASGQYNYNSGCYDSCPWGTYISGWNCVTCDGTCLGSSQILWSCSNPAYDSRWAYNGGWGVVNCGGYNFVGPYTLTNNLNAPNLVFANSHNGLKISFLFGSFDSWDHERFVLVVDGVDTFQERPCLDRGSRVGICRNTAWGEQLDEISVGVNHTSQTLSLQFFSELDQDVTDESWGVCNVAITTYPYSVDPYGNALDGGAPNYPAYVTYFSCANANRDVGWTYWMGYTKQACGGRWYLGGFGTGETLTKDFNELPAHQSVHIKFQLASIDSWDWEWFYLYLDSTRIVYNQYVLSASNRAQICGSSSWNDFLDFVDVQANHNSNFMTLTFGSTLDQYWTDEAWGICDLEIWFNPCPVGQYLQGSSSCVSSCSWGFVENYDTGNCDPCSSSSNTCISSGTTIYPSNNIQALPGWTYNQGFSSVQCAGYSFLGKYGTGGVASGPVKLTQPHSYIILTFRLASIDSWDYEHFYVAADSVLVFDQYFWTYADGRSNICQTGWWDEIDVFTIGFAHNSPDLTLQFWSSLDQLADDEAWAISDITFTLTNNQVDKYGRYLTDQITATTLTAFASSSTVRENNWDYVPYYSNIQCGSNWYVGRFGNGGSISTNYFNLPSHQALTFQFNLGFIDSWNGEAFLFKVDGNVVYQRSWVSNVGTNVCGAGFPDSFVPVVVTVGHQASTVSLQLYSTASQSYTNQGWGICDFTILVNSCPGSQYLYGTTCVANCPWGYYALQTDRICNQCTDGSTCVTSSYTYYPTSGPQAITGWTYNPNFNTYQCPGDSNNIFLRYTTGQSVSGRLYMGSVHTAVLLSFRMISIDSWDWEYFNVYADNNLVFSESYWWGEDGRVQLCSNIAWLDDAENYITAFNHTSQTLDLLFNSTLNQDYDDESWGLADLTITLINCGNGVGVDNFGRCLNSGSDSRTYTVFASANMAKDLYWSYLPGYVTYGCAAEAFLGRYGAGGEVTTYFRGLPDHQSVVVKFSVLATDQWTTQEFIIQADGVNVYNQSFSWSDDARAPLCGTDANDVVDILTVSFNHNLNQLGLTFTSNVDQSFQYQGWGISDVEVSFNVCPQDQFLAGSVCVDSCPWGQFSDPITKNCLACNSTICSDINANSSLILFPCNNPAKLSQFTYVSKYSTTTSGGSTYVGQYTQGDFITGSIYFANPHSGVDITFQLAIFGQWNDVFAVEADGVTVFSQTITASQTITLGYNHTTSVSNLKFFANVTTTAKSWAICGITITPMDCPVDKYGQGIPVVESNGDIELSKSMYNTIQQIACLCSSGAALPPTFLTDGYLSLVQSSTGGSFDICDIAKASYCFISCGACQCNGKTVTSPSAQALEAIVLKTSMAQQTTCPNGCKNTFNTGQTYTGDNFPADCANFNVDNVKYQVSQTSSTTLTQTIIVEQRADADDNQPQPTTPPRSTTTINFGPTPPVTTCSNQVFNTTTITSDLINILGDATISASNNFTLTSGIQNQRSAIWYKNPVDITKGFMVEFMLNLLNPTCTQITFTETRNYVTTNCTVTTDTFDNTVTNQVCTSTPQTEILTYQKNSDNCGAEGVAFVIQPNDANQIGADGAGLGYEGILNALAIEFDASYNYVKNDPDNTNSRHISIILKKGAADALEDNSIAWNDQPLDFIAWNMSSTVAAGQVVNPLVRIEYMGYQIRVYLNNILQLSYSYQLNLATALSLSSPQFYIGFTGTTSDLVQTSSIFAWNLNEVQPYADTSVAKIYYPSGATQDQINNFMAAGTPFDVYITIMDKCSNPYPFTDLSQISLADVNGIQVFGNNTCTLLTKELNTNTAVAAHFKLSISCSIAKLNYVNIQFGGRAILNQPLMWRTIAGPASSASVLFNVDGTNTIGLGNTDDVFFFMLNVTDAYGNAVPATPVEVVSALQITWPNPSDSKQTHTAVFSTDTQLFYIFVDADKIGVYTISSPWFSKGYTYQFVINGGLANSTTSSAELVDLGFAPLTNFSGLEVGQNTILVLLHVRDSKWNELPIKTQSDIAVQLYWTYDETGLSIITAPVPIQHQLLQTHPSFNINQQRQQAYFELVPTAIGVNAFVAYIFGGKAACAACTLNFVPGPYVFQNTRIWVWNPNLNIYYDDLQPSSTVFNNVPFTFLVVLRDAYGNVIDTNPFNFEIVMSGYNMVPMNLTACNQTYKFAKLYTACTNDLAHEFQHLVGKLGYDVTITDTADNTIAPLGLKIDIISAWDDTDAGNGPFVPQFTAWWPYLDFPYVWAGQENYYFIVLLKQSEGKRFNDWIDTSRISVRIYDTNGSELTRDPRVSIWTSVYWKWGYYAIGTNIQKSGTMTYQLTIDGISYSNILNYTELVQPWVPDNGYIQTDVLAGGTGVIFNDGCVEYTQNFVLYVYDQYKNPSNAAANRINLEIQGANGLYWSPTITKDTSVDGKYYVSWNTPYAMNYTIGSYYFRNNAAGHAYYIYMRPGFPSRVTSYSQLLLDPSQGTTLVATDVVYFAIRPRDRFGNDIPTGYFINKTDNFTLAFIDPLTQLQVPMTNNTQGANLVNKVTNANAVFVIWTQTLNRAGTTAFRPLLQGQSVVCSVCSILVDPNVGYFPNAQISFIQNGDTTVVSQNDTITLNNYQTYPIFTLQMADIVYNLRTIDDGWSNFNASLLNSGNSTIYNYSLTPAIWASGIKFAFQTLDPQIVNYQESVYNRQWSLVFSANMNGETYKQIFPNILMYGQGPSLDADYDNADIDPTKTVVVPSYQTLEAGTATYVTLQIRTVNDKIRKETYPNVASAIQVNLTPANTAIRTSVRSAGSYGQYIITLYGEKAQNYTINVSILDDSGNMRPISQQPILNIYPTTLDHSVLQSDQNDEAGNPLPLTVDYNYTFILTPYDRFANVIYNIATRLAGVVVLPQLANQIIFNSIGRTLLPSGLYQYTINQQTAATVLLSARFLQNNDGAWISYLQLTFKPGQFNAIQSIGKLIPDQINAGQTFILTLYPRDQYGNAIVIEDPTQEDPSTVASRFSLVQTYPNGTNVNITVISSEIYTWKFDPNATITLAGDHKFTLTYSGAAVTLAKSILTVWPLPADFSSTQLYQYDPSKNIQTPYNGTSFAFDATELPTVAVILKDQYNNTILQFPTTWDLQVYIRDTAEQLDPITLCSSTNQFSICQPDQSSWYSLAPTVEYSIFVTWGTSGKLYWNFGLYGYNSSNSDLSNYPLSVQSSVLSPTSDQSITAGQSINFFIELIAEDGGRKAINFTNPNDNITFSIPGLINGQDFTVNATYGNQAGRYIATLTIFKASASLTPYLAQLVLVNTYYDTAIPKITVSPASYNYTVALFSNLTAYPDNVTTLESSSTDYTYAFYIRSVDLYDNLVSLALSDIGFTLYDPFGNLAVTTSTLLSPGLVKASFQPVLIGTYTIETKGVNFTFTISAGTPDSSYTNSTVDQTTNLTAGTNFTFTIYAFDKFGNPTNISADLVTLFSVYYKQDSDLFYQYASYINNSINANSLQFTANITQQGDYQLFATLSGIDLTCQTCALSVIPGDIYPLNSQLYYYNLQGQQFVYWSPSSLVREDNTIYTPLYSLQVADVYGNVYSSFPSSYASNVSFKLTPPANDSEAIPAPGYVLYNTNLTDGIFLINVSYDSNVTYVGASQINGSYTLTATIGGVAIPYSVFLLGDGASDLDASYGDLDVNQTYVSRNSIITSVTNHELIMIELRTADGKRKKDVTFPNITLAFTYLDNQTNYTVSDGDMPGRYLINLQTNRSYPAFANQTISYYIDGNLSNVTTPWIVVPGPTRYIVNSSDLSVLGSTDTDFVIRIVPRDAYNNTAVAVPEDLYVTFITPDNSSIQYTAKTDTTGEIVYNIQATVSGQYSFISWMFIDGENNKFFNIKAGIINGARSNATLEVNSTVAGNKVRLYVFPKDSNGNLVSNNDTSVGTAFSISYSLNESPDEIAYPVYFAPSNNPDFAGAIYTNLSFTLAGNYKFFVQTSQTTLTCTNSCSLYVSFDTPVLSNTQFLIFGGNNQFQEATSANMQAGSNNINIDVNIYDQYLNPITSYTDQQQFLAVWSGHNMTEIVLNITINNGDLTLSVPTDLQNNVSWLIPASDYNIQIFYQEFDIVANGFLNISNYTLQMVINGVASDAGNGPMVPQHAKIDVTSNQYSNSSSYINMTAGTQVSFVVTLRTINDERYNEDFNPTNISVAALNQSNWYFDWYSAGAKNVFTIYATTNVSTTLETLTVYIDSVPVGQPINVQVNPNVPDLSKTVLYRPLVVQNQELFDIVFDLYDTYGNQFFDAWTLSNFTATVNSGNVIIVNTNPVKLPNNSLDIQLVPSYPPITFSLQLSYSIDGVQTVSVFGGPLNFTVLPIFDPYRTAVTANIFTTGINSDNVISYTIYLYDTEGYCYQPVVSFNTSISGPYASNDPNNNNLVGGSLTVNSLTTPVAVPQSTSDVSSCQLLYTATFAAGTAKTTGYYRIQVFINDSNNNTLTVYDQKALNVIAGPMSAPQSTIFVPGRQNLGSQPWTLQVGVPFTFFLQAYDDNQNIITDARSDVVDVSLNSSYYNRTVNYFSNGTWAFTFVINVTGEYPSTLLNFNVNNQTINSASIQSSNFPTSFILTPGDCSHVYPVITPNFDDATVLVGDNSSFILTCNDIYGNRVQQGGAQFTASVQGNQLPIVGSDILNTIITDNQDGTYTVTFQPSWAGVYTATFFITESANSADTNYGSPQNFTAIWSQCNTANPWQCPNIDECVPLDGYSQCDGLVPSYCINPLQPISCTVKGIPNQCVESPDLCDIPTGYSSCSQYGDNKIVPSDQVNNLCPAVGLGIFDQCIYTDTTAQCDDTSCRYSFADCPSPAVCPPGYTRCYDDTCVTGSSTCQTSYDPCPDGSIRCPTMECQSDITFCTSRVTCAPGEYVCLTDNSCVSSSAQCAPASSNGPPANPVCGSDLPTLCSNGICVDTFSSCPTTAQRRRLLDDGNGTVAVFASGCPAPMQRCPGGECVYSVILCPTVTNCPPNAIRCSDNTCASSSSLCYSATCTGQTAIQCWNGICVDDQSKCPTRSSCPNSKPVKCHDGTCSDSIYNCAEYISCPSYLPVRCDAGDCRQNKNDCPTIPTCPTSLPILCQDGSCRKSVQYCEGPSGIVIPQGKIRCPDGSFALSLSLCPTGITCVIGYLKCWDGACVSDPSLCSTPIDAYNGAIRCPDGSVRTNIQDCPTRIICPQSAPVYCDDGNCRQSSSQCFANTCPSGLRICPDGTCALSSCGTPITCSSDAPYKCYDDTCRSDPSDCPAATACPQSTAILCPDGTCVQDRMFCKAFQPCDSSTPVRCPNMACATSADACTALDVCPQGTITCDDGSCAPDATSCKPVTCPPHISFRCPDGFCVADSTTCDITTNACPSNKPLKCADGLCVSNSNMCNNNATYLACPAAAILCPDGSCAPEGQCPLANGCPTNTPLRCATGDCVDPNSVNCTITICPSDAPIKCLNGFCAKSNLFCIASFSNEDVITCANEPNGNIVPCADGRCVSSSDLCRPILPCPSGQTVRCNDGSCRTVISQCPKDNNCPAGRSYRCSSGVCAIDSTYCPQPNGCPTFASTKCSLTGDCAYNQTVCQTIYNFTVLPNNCTASNPYLCPSGGCVATKPSCPKISDCPDSEFLCPDKICRPFWRYDPLFPESIGDNCLAATGFCPPTSFICPDLSCQANWSDCKATNNCPVNTPFQCSDGSCKAEPTGPNGCSPSITCDDRIPFLCADGTCVGDPSLCRVLPPCPANSPWRCADRSCTSDSSTCRTQSICPITTPIFCKVGGCVSSVIQCANANGATICPSANPFSCASGICVNHPLKCFMGTAVQDMTTASSRRLLDTLSVSTSDNYGCPTSTTRCADGTCRANSADCPTAIGCYDLSMPYKCSSGRCGASAADCANDFVQTCSTGTTLCEDGLCRASCLAYNGCPLSKPLLCPDGYCGVNLGECSGESSCDNDKPFRCADGTCAPSFLQCQRAIRTFKPADVEVSVSPYSSQTIDFIYSNDSFITYATLTIPSGAFSIKTNQSTSGGAAQYTGYYINAVPDSLLVDINSTLIVGSEVKAQKLFPLVQNQLAFHQAVRSAAVNLTVDTTASSTYNFALLLTIIYDPPSQSVDVSDYCLGIVSNNSWVCVSRNYVSYDAETNTLSYLIPQDGIWAILYNPNPVPPPVLQDNCTSWACQNKMATLAIAIASTIIFCIIAYYMHRIYRYQVKYRETKVTLANYKEKIAELQTTKTNIYGQTLRDKVEGISFVANPLYEKYLQETIQNQESRYSELETALEKKKVEDKEFESTHKKLSSENRILSQELQKLKNQLAAQNLKKNDKFKVRKSIKVSEFL